MDRPPIPSGLKARLRVLASHERDRQTRQATIPARFQYWTGRMRLAFDNMMRPMALPFAGGLMTALLLMGIWVPFLSTKQGANDVPLPTWIYAQATPQDYPVVEEELVIELIIDERGRVADWRVIRGKMTPALSASLLGWRFDPAMRFGRPIIGKVVYAGSSPVSVRG